MANQDEHDLLLEMLNECIQELEDLPEQNEMVSTMETLKKSREEVKRMFIDGRTTLVAKISIHREIMKEAGEGKEEGVAMDVRDQLKMRATKLENNLYRLFTQVTSMFPRIEEKVTCYDEFQACLRRLLEPGNMVVRAIMKRLKEDKEQVRDDRVDELLLLLLGHKTNVKSILDVVGSADQDTSSWGRWIKEREDVEKKIELKINTLKGIYHV